MEADADETPRWNVVGYAVTWFHPSGTRLMFVADFMSAQCRS